MCVSRTLVLSGIRSGKTALAEQLAIESGDTVVYVATATVGDEEMARRVQRHAKNRPRHWRLAEEPLRLARALVGLGTIGMDPLTRRFCDELGWLNQALATTCDRVVLSFAGLPLWLRE